MSERNLILLEDGWNTVKTKAVDRIIEILNTDLGKSFNRAEYMTIYTIVYNMCNQKPPHNYSAQMYDRYAITFRDYLSSIVRPKLQTAQDSAFLPEVDKHWKNHLIMLKWMKHFFQYVDRFYVSHNNVPNLTETSMRIFYNTIFEPFRDKAVEEFIRFLTRDREGEDVNRAMLKNISNMFIQMGSIHNPEASHEIYTNTLEARVLESTAQYYQATSAGWILEDSCPEFLLKAERALNEEIARVEHVLAGSSKEKVIDVFLREVVLGNETKFLEKETGIYNMLINDKIEELSRLYRLCVKVGLPPIATAFTNYLKTQGEAIISDKERSLSAEKKEVPSDPGFIKALISIIERFKWIISSSFNNNTIFQRALKQGMESIMNGQVGKYSISEILANYCDKLLKKTSERLRDDELEEELTKSIELFEHLTEKDLFAHIYRSQLAKRLLNEQSASEDAEKSIISKMKLCCGAQFTSRMEGMLTDLHLAEDTFKKFESTNPSLPIEFKAQVLTSGYWPTYKFHNVALPNEFTSCINTFESYYSESTRHRKLQWIYSLGTTVLSGTFKGKKYDFFCSTYQACVLYLFNQAFELTFEDIRTAMNFDEETCKKVLMPLVIYI